MINKYYKPDLTDLFIGYECELEDNGEYCTLINATEDRLKEMWLNDEDHPNAYKITITKDNLYATISDMEFTDIRTKYLTKEQIEAEGWEYDGTFYGEMTFNKGDWDLYYNKENNKLKIENQNNFNFDLDIPIPSFMGFCPSINEFRKIQKLLGI